MTIALLLPACIAPGKVAMTTRVDPKLRETDHFEALTSWISSRWFERIVWCENSGWSHERMVPLVDHARSLGISLELIGFRDNDSPPERGKGYSEMGSIAYAFDHSRLLAETTHVCKASARYFITNGKSLRGLVDGPSAVDVACDLKRGLTVADARWFAGSARFYREHLIPRRDMIFDTRQVFFEHALASAVHAAMANGMSWALPSELPRISGVTASTGKPIRLSASKRLRHILKRRMFAY